MIAHIAVAIRGFVRGVYEPGLIGAVGEAGGVRILDAKVLEVAFAIVLGAAIIRIAVGRKVLAHVHLRAGERRRRHGHDGCSSKGEAYAKLFERVDGVSFPHFPSQRAKALRCQRASANKDTPLA